MSFSSADRNETEPLSDPVLEDFRRLGVRPFECRQTVIRLAALRTTRSLANQQLSAPSEQVALQLSRVVTSAYRVLDPRQREDPIQRMLVGRILADELSVAGRTNFLTEFYDQQREFSSGDVSAVEDRDLQALTGETAPQPNWTISLAEQDLVAEHPILRRIKQARRRSHYHRSRYVWFSLIVAAVTMGALTSMAMMRKHDDFAEHQGASEAIEPVDRSPVASPAVGDQQGSALAVNGSEIAGLESSLESVLMPSPPHREDPPSGPPLAMSVVPRVEILRTELDQAGSTERQAGRQAGPFQRNLVPNADEVRAARRYLVAKLPRWSDSVDFASVAARMAQLEAVTRQQTAGTAAHWAAILMFAEQMWLVEDMQRVQSQLASQANRYQVELPRLLADTFMEACTLAQAPENFEHLSVHGLRLCDWLLIHESIDPCRQVVEKLSEVAQATGQPLVIERVQEYSDAIAQMSRLLSSTNRWAEQQEYSSVTKDTGIAGRYYCLMLRRWDLGLPWLVEASDNRISAVAKQELEINDDRSTVLVAQRWIQIAKSYQGRFANSMRLHAVDLLRGSLAGATAIQQLEIQRQINQVIQLLPQDLRSVAAVSALPSADQNP